jgi:hypothetical protein
MTVEQMAEGLPHPNIGVPSIGDIRAIGGDVITSFETDNSFHVTIIPRPGGTQELSGAFDIQPNPWVSP